MMRHAPKQAALLGLGACLLGSDAMAGNLDAFYLSGEAAMQGGAITANSRGGGAVWYNPAGLAFLTGTRLDVSVNGYALRFGGQADFDPPDPTTEVTRLSRLDLNVVPTALTLTQRFGDVGVGVGAFVPNQSLSVLRTRLYTPPNAAGDSVDFVYDASERIQTYHLGAAAGFQPSKELSLGISLLVNYQTLLSTNDINVHVTTSDVEVGVANHYTVDTQQFGLEMILGGQWAFKPNWNLGLAVRTSALKLGEIIQVIETGQTGSTSGVLNVSTIFDESIGIGTSIISPFRFHTGVSRDFEDTRYALEVSLQLPFDDGTYELRPTWNARLGARHVLGPRMAIGGGIFTDQSPNPEPTDFQDAQLNFYGATVAVDLGTPYGIHSKDGVPFESPRTLLFGTTIALSYALGLGSVVRAEVGPDADEGIRFVTSPADVIAHEFTLHLGSTIME